MLSRAIPCLVFLFALTTMVQAAETAVSSVTEGLTIRLTGPANPIVLGEQVPMTATIVNSGSTAITLVRPGDGSESGWRTPLIGWAVQPVDQKAAYPADVPVSKRARCKSMNILKASEIVTLEPGKELVLDAWIGGPDITAPGSYRVRLYYRNVPEHKWHSGDTEAVQAMRASTPCFVISNEVEVTITAKAP